MNKKNKKKLENFKIIMYLILLPSITGALMVLFSLFSGLTDKFQLLSNFIFSFVSVYIGLFIITFFEESFKDCLEKKEKK